MPPIEAVNRDPYSSYEQLDLKNVIDTLEEAGEFQKAHDCLSEALKRSPREPKLYARRGYCLVNLKRPQEALIDLNQALALRPKTPTLAEIYKLMGMCHGNLGDDVLGVDYFKKAAELGDAYSIGVLSTMGIDVKNP